MKKYNFSSGPATLPQSLFEEASKAVIDYQNSGLSILEISHRSDTFVEIIEGAKSLVVELLDLEDDFEVLFLTGGASMQFCQVPFNLLPSNGTATYLDTGTWSEKAVKEAKLFGNVEVLASSKSSTFNHIPKNYVIPQEADYFHITTNNTIYGTQVHDIPTSPIPIVADMSSDIFSKQINMNQFGLVYAGAQKNLGPAGTTLVLVRKSLLGKTGRAIPSMMDYQVHIAKKSAFNTPPVFPIYCCYLGLQWIKEQGITQLEKNNRLKAKLVYEEIDRNSLIEGHTAVQDRSMMNATFILKNPELESVFVDLTDQANCVGVQGHRSVGGFRASIYNAMPIEGVQTLIEVMQELERKFG
ncbi:MAG: 3-phosphoserine/phosphohydroxythreonine transaminase [Chitinophagales bacterium]